jgi:hypothetical protein
MVTRLVSSSFLVDIYKGFQPILSPLRAGNLTA